MAPDSKKIIVIHPGALGDQLLAAPALFSLRQKFPDHKIAAYSSAPVWKLFRGLVDEWRDIETSKIHTLFARPDNTIFGNAEIAITWMGHGDADFVGNLRKSTGAEKVVAASPNPQDRVHASRHVVSTLAGLGVNFPDALPRYNADDFHDAQNKLIASLGKPGIAEMGKLLVVHPGSGSEKKCAAPEYFARLIDWWAAEGGEALIVEGPADAAYVQRLLRICGPIPVLKTEDLETLSVLFAKCFSYVGNDSGLSHLAAASGNNTVAIFCATDPEIWAPLGENVTIIEGDNIRNESEKSANFSNVFAQLKSAVEKIKK